MCSGGSFWGERRTLTRSVNMKLPFWCAVDVFWNKHAIWGLCWCNFRKEPSFYQPTVSFRGSELQSANPKLDGPKLSFIRFRRPKNIAPKLNPLSPQISPKTSWDLANCDRNPVGRFARRTVEFAILVSGDSQFTTLHPKYVESKMPRCCLAAETRCIGNPLSGYCVSIIGFLRFQQMWLGCFVVDRSAWAKMEKSTIDIEYSISITRRWLGWIVFSLAFMTDMCYFHLSTTTQI